MVTITEFIILAGSLGTAGLAIAAFINISKPLGPKIIRLFTLLCGLFYKSLVT